MRSICSAAVAFALSTAPWGVAGAAPRANLVFKITDDSGRPKCAIEGQPAPSKGRIAVIHFKHPAWAKVESFTADGERVDLQELALDAEASSLTLLRAPALETGGPLVWEVNGAPCGSAAIFATDEGSDSEAARYLLTDKGQQALTDLRKSMNATAGKTGTALPWGTHLRVHLPSGALAAPAPAALTEGTPLQLVWLRTEDSKTRVKLTVDKCDPVEVLKFKEPAAATEEKPPPVGEKHGDQRAWGFEAIDAYRACGGTMSYKLKVGDGEEHTFDIRMRPKYHWAAVAMYGYDFGGTTKYEKKPVAGQDDTFTIERVSSPRGPGLMVGGQWMVGGVDYENYRWWNSFLNLFLVVDPAAPTKHMAAGVALSPVGGLSFAAGASLNVGSRLKNGLCATGDPNAETCNTLKGAGEPPVEDTWKDISPGVFVGIMLDHRIADAVTNAFKAGKDGEKKEGEKKDDGKKDDGKKDDGKKDGTGQTADQTKKPDPAAPKAPAAPAPSGTQTPAPSTTPQ